MLQKRDLGDAILVINLMSQSNESKLHVMTRKNVMGLNSKEAHKRFRNKFNAVMSEIMFTFYLQLLNCVVGYVVAVIER